MASVTQQVLINTAHSPWWPEEAINYCILADGDRFWGVNDFAISYNTQADLRRRVPASWQYDYDNITDETTYPGLNNTAGPYQIVMDATYVYFIWQSQALITRVNRTGDLSTKVMLSISNGVFPNRTENGQNVAYGQIYNGKFYYAWRGTWAGVANQMRIIVVDLVNFTEGAVTTFQYSTDTANYPEPYSLTITSNGVLLLSTLLGAAGSPSRLYYADVNNLTSFSFVATTWNLGIGVASGTSGYYLQGPQTFSSNNGYSHLATNVVRVDASAGPGTPPTLTYVSLLDDPNIFAISQDNNSTAYPWLDGSGNILFLCNYTRDLTANQTVAGTNRYIARRSLPSLATNGGIHVSQFINYKDTFPLFGCYQGGYNYILSVSWFGDSGQIFKINEALTSGVVIPPLTTSLTPSNNNFADAITITPGTSSTATGIPYYANTEVGEFLPLSTGSASAIVGANVVWDSHSAWWKFTPPISGYYTVTANFAAGAWTGSTVGTLTLIADNNSGFTNTFTWYALVDVPYHIQLCNLQPAWDDFGEQASPYSLSLSEVSLPINLVDMGWYRPISGAPRTARAKPGFSSVPFDTVQIPPYSNMGWYQPLSRPLRQAKARLDQYTMPQAIKRYSNFGWYRPLSEVPNGASTAVGYSTNTLR